MTFSTLNISFKPYYKWITFNTVRKVCFGWVAYKVLNLIINGLPLILSLVAPPSPIILIVLNLIINGLPLILYITGLVVPSSLSFKPYYKWITFNTPDYMCDSKAYVECFKPYYKWITFNTMDELENNKLSIEGFKPYYKWITFNTKF